MQARTISDALRSMIGERKVTAAFFTTYSFEPAFFELEVLPLLLDAAALSTHEATRYYQLQSLMGAPGDKLEVAVLYDMSVFDPELAPRLEVTYMPMRAGADCQHAKIMVIALEDKDTSETSWLLGAGSFNLTRAGWWENLEVGHWVELRTDYAPTNIVRPLCEALAYYKRQGPCSVTAGLLEQFRKLKVTSDDPNCHFYFSGHGPGRRNFAEFIGRRIPANRQPLEIISPFFADNADHQVLRDFLKRYSRVSVLLPLDENKHALVDRASVYDKLPDDKTQWASWKTEAIRPFIPRDQYRRLHAKIFNAPGARGWTFVGSVNLSVKALRHNVEAGFLLTGCRPQTLLQPLDAEPEQFNIETEAETSQGDAAMGLPPIQASFDWLSKTLTLHAAQAGTLTLFDSDNSKLLVARLSANEVWKIKQKWPEADTPSLPTAFIAQLERSSLVHTHWKANKGQGSGLLVVSQENLYCKPAAVPNLDLNNHLHIFLGMDDARRLAELTAAIQRHHRQMRSEEKEGEDEDPPPAANGHPESFFSAFSLVNGAFWSLAKRLELAAQQGDSHTLSYYLEGHQPDSLRALLHSCADATASPQGSSVVVRYLALLSAKELLERYSSHTDPQLHAAMRHHIGTLEQNSLLPLLAVDTASGCSAQVEDSMNFLSWFKEKFAEPVDQLIRSAEEGGRFETD